MAIENISKDKYKASPVKRSLKSVLTAMVGNLPEAVLEKVLEWRLVSEMELAAPESVEGTLVSQGTTEWTINRRTIPAGIYQVKFTASYTIGDAVFSRTLTAFDYGFIEVIAAPIKAIIEGGSSSRWGTTEMAIVNGSLSYDGDIGPGSYTELSFAWSCLFSGNNVSVSNDCFGSFVGHTTTSTVSIDTSKLEIGKDYVLTLAASKDERTSFAKMSFEVAAGEIPKVSLR